jgi:hypothetical protein
MKSWLLRYYLELVCLAFRIRDVQNQFTVFASFALKQASQVKRALQFRFRGVSIVPQVFASFLVSGHFEIPALPFATGRLLAQIPLLLNREHTLDFWQLTALQTHSLLPPHGLQALFIARRACWCAQFVSKK